MKQASRSCGLRGDVMQSVVFAIAVSPRLCRGFVEISRFPLNHHDNDPRQSRGLFAYTNRYPIVFRSATIRIGVIQLPPPFSELLTNRVSS
jgi:hypothetical protein